ncbi:MAG: hypothetical protein E7639_01985 [Ruminococcaceae bacterium]|nr:hypothetical protein [Oscillospiraceae bacterium]
MKLQSLFEIEAREYQNIAFTAQSADTARIVVLGLCAGLLLAMLYTLYLRVVPGSLARALLQRNANTPERAQALDSLHLPLRGFVVASLAHNTTLQRLVKIAPHTEADGGKEKSPARYYIPEENVFRAESLYSKRGNPIIQLFLALFGCTALAVLLCKLIPVALSMIDAIL